MTTTNMADEDDLDDIHWAIIDKLREGRGTPSYLADHVGESRQLVSNRIRDLQMADIVTFVHRGLYELNPEEVPEKEGDPDE